MAISVFDLFKVGIGPSSSHTVGPMVAARSFVEGLGDELNKVGRLRAELFGSLGATGRGHGTHKAVMLGFQGDRPESVDTDTVEDRWNELESQQRLRLSGGFSVPFNHREDLVFNRGHRLPHHPNGMRFSAYDNQNELLGSRVFYSVGGGFVVNEADAEAGIIVEDQTRQPFPFETGDALLSLCQKNAMSVSDLMLQNESVWRSTKEVQSGLLSIWQVMQTCVQRGCVTTGVLPGLKVRRRAADLYRQLSERPEDGLKDPLTVMDWVNLYALAVNEENAAGGRVVTAPTNGAAGIIPAVLHYYRRFCPGADDTGIVRFLLTCGAIGILFKRNASISGAEVGCQGEVGSACSMAAAGLAEVLGGTPEQVENAAEIAMEHNLGLTCDPVAGLVQVPCIERNAMASIKAINAARLALRGDGRHLVSLDKVIKTMRDTGRDMQEKYKETARGGLAVNVVEVPVNFIEC